jgi:uncharacterized protein (DUF305 family)
MLISNYMQNIKSLIPSADHIKTIIYTSVATTVMTSVTLFVQTKIEEAKKLAAEQMNMQMAGHEMENMMADMTKGLQGKTGQELEKEFIKEMIPHHQGAVDMARLLLADKTTKPVLRKFAENIIAAQEGEIKQMNIWLESYK